MSKGKLYCRLKRKIKMLRYELNKLRNKKDDGYKKIPPSAYYKYTNQKVLRLFLKNKSIRFTNPIHFNDPMDSTIPEFNIDEHLVYKFILDYVRRDLNVEGEPPYKVKRELLNDINKTKSELRGDYIKIQDEWDQAIQQFRVLSLTIKGDNVLMWSHYANEHRGVAIKFKKTLSFGEPKFVDYTKGATFINKVIHHLLGYMVKFGIKKSESENECIERVSSCMLDVIIDYLFMKRSDWSYERECRIVYPANENIIKNHGKVDLVSVQPEDVDAIIIGASVSNLRAKRLKKLINGRMPGVKVHKYERRGWELVLTENFD